MRGVERTAVGRVSVIARAFAPEGGLGGATAFGDLGTRRELAQPGERIRPVVGRERGGRRTIVLPETALLELLAAAAGQGALRPTWSITLAR